MSTKSRHAKWLRRQLARIAEEHDGMAVFETTYRSGPMRDYGTYFERLPGSEWFTDLFSIPCRFMLTTQAVALYSSFIGGGN